MYAVGRDETLGGLAQRVIDAIAAGPARATTSVGVIEEFTHVAARRRGRPEAVALARRFVRLLSPLRVEEPADLELGLTLFERNPSLGSFDALLAAVAIAREDTLLSPDPDFAGIASLRFVDLTGAALDDLLGDAGTPPDAQ